MIGNIRYLIKVIIKVEQIYIENSYQKLLNVEKPAARRGKLTASPSGKF